METNYKSLADFVKDDVKSGAFVTIHASIKKYSNDGSHLTVEDTFVASTKKDYKHTTAYNPNGRGRPAKPVNPDCIIVPHALKVNENTGNTLLSVYLNPNNGYNRRYFRNGEEVSKDVFEASLKSSKNRDGNSNYRTYNADSITMMKQGDREWHKGA